MRPKSSRCLLLPTLLLAPSLLPGQAEEADALVLQFREGDILNFDEVSKLESFLPKQLRDRRDFFFHERMQLEIGPSMRDYSPSEPFQAATEKNRGQPRVGSDNNLENYTAGRPFPVEEIDCKSDSLAGGSRGDGKLRGRSFR